MLVRLSLPAVLAIVGCSDDSVVYDADSAPPLADSATDVRHVVTEASTGSDGQPSSSAGGGAAGSGGETMAGAAGSSEVAGDSGVTTNDSGPDEADAPVGTDGASSDGGASEAATWDGAASFDSAAHADASSDSSADSASATSDSGSEAGDSAISLNDANAPSDASSDARADTSPATVLDATPADAAADQNQVDVTTDVASGPTLRFSFESGLQSWQAESHLSIAATTVHADTGSQSLAVTMTNASFNSVLVPSPPTGLNPGAFSFRIYIPSATTLTVLQPFDQVADHPPAYDWEGRWFEASELAAIPRDSWQTISAQVATSKDGVARTEPFFSMGVQLSGNGVVYIDSVAW